MPPFFRRNLHHLCNLLLHGGKHRHNPPLKFPFRYHLHHHCNPLLRGGKHSSNPLLKFPCRYRLMDKEVRP
jgi:hypothetical protein